MRCLGLQDFLEGQYLPARLNMTAGSAEQIRVSLGLFDRWLGRPATFADLSKESLLAWMRWLAESRAPATVNSKRAALLALWNQATEDGLCVPSSRIPKAREPRRLPIAWTLGEVESILHAADKLSGTWNGISVALAWRVAFLVFWDTGCRLRTVLKAELRHVDVGARTLYVPAEHVKGRRADRMFLLHEQTVAAIGESLPSSRKMLFPFPFGRRQIWQHLKRILRAAGLPCDRRRMFHCFRRSAESHAAASRGIEFAAAAIGHGVEVARRSYVSPLICRPPALIDGLPRPRLR